MFLKMLIPLATQTTNPTLFVR